MIRPLQMSMFPRIGSQQASTTPLQALVVPAQTSTTTGGIDISSIMNLMITMMIVVMMMKMMTGSMASLGGTP